MLFRSAFLPSGSDLVELLGDTWVARLLLAVALSIAGIVSLLCGGYDELRLRSRAECSVKLPATLHYCPSVNSRVAISLAACIVCTFTWKLRDALIMLAISSTTFTFG